MLKDCSSTLSLKGYEVYRFYSISARAITLFSERGSSLFQC